MAIIDHETLPRRIGSIYPEPYAGMMAGRSSLRLGDAGGLTQFGANLVTLEPGALSSLRHWHLNEDEFVMITQGTCTLVQDEGPTIMVAGDCATFPAGVPNAHHFINHSTRPAVFLVIGTRSASEVVTYSDVDFLVEMKIGKAEFAYRDGTRWTGPR